MEPDGVLVLEAVLSVGATPIVTCFTLLELALLPTGLAGEISPLGVLGLELDPFILFVVERAELLPDVGVLLGILDGVVSSVLSKDKFDPCLDGGLLPGLLPVLDCGLELLLDPPGVSVDL